MKLNCIVIVIVIWRNLPCYLFDLAVFFLSRSLFHFFPTHKIIYFSNKFLKKRFNNFLNWTDLSDEKYTFDSLESATRARENLNGADIYSGCCTLKIDFAKVSKEYIIFLFSLLLFIIMIFNGFIWNLNSNMCSIRICIGYRMYRVQEIQKID